MLDEAYKHFIFETCLLTLQSETNEVTLDAKLLNHGEECDCMEPSAGRRATEQAREVNDDDDDNRTHVQYHWPFTSLSLSYHQP